MEKLLNDLLLECKKDKKRFLTLKKLAVNCQLFELSANLRDVETELFPEPQEHLNAKIEADKLNLLFRMVELNIPNSIAWLISETIKLHKSKKGKFSIQDAANLLARKNQIWNDLE
jgi:hypothetical protein